MRGEDRLWNADRHYKLQCTLLSAMVHVWTVTIWTTVQLGRQVTQSNRTGRLFSQTQQAGCSFQFNRYEITMSGVLYHRLGASVQED